ncbi:MAG: glucokinase, partial [Thermoprotei archaeon]
GGQVKITNLSWHTSELALKSVLKASHVAIINDVYATAYSIPFLSDSDVHTLSLGMSRPGETVAVVAPGTGLGEAFITYERGRPIIHPSEGGHCDFPPRNDEESALLSYLRSTEVTVDVESVCSGPGITRIYRYIRGASAKYSSEPYPQGLDEQDPTPAIVEAALADPEKYPACWRALEMFCDILASEAGNFALKVMSTGGVYLAGGIPVKVLPALKSVDFIHIFSDKRNMANILSEIPVKVVTTEKAALIGAARYGYAKLQTEGATV